MQRITLDKPQKNNRQFTRRLMFAVGLIAVLCILLITRLAQLQIQQYERYRTLSTNNQINVIPIRPNRGLIYDRNGILLAENYPVYSLDIIPEHVADMNATIDELKTIIHITDKDIQQFKRLLKQRHKFEPIPLKLSMTEDEVARISVDLYRYPAVTVSARLMRHYPLGESFSHVVGYVSRINEQELKRIDSANYVATNYIGKLGVEKYYEDILHGRIGYEEVESDARGRKIRVLNHTAPIPGNDIYLTIDSEFQLAVEDILAESGLRGAIVAMEPRGGDILAMVSMPSYNPNPFVQGIDHASYHHLLNDTDRPLYNRAIRGLYPLASTIKPYIAIQALESGLFTKDFRINDHGWYSLPNSEHRYRDWKRKGHGRVDMERAVVVSCDTYFYTLADRMGIRNIEKVLKEFGFGSPTGVEMQEELAGVVPSPEWKKAHRNEPWYRGDTIVAGIGQGYILATPMQMVQAIATIATQGQRMQPHLLLKQVTYQGDVVDYAPKASSQLALQESTWAFIRHSLEQVIQSWEGTAHRLSINLPYSIAGKTGTAQVFSTSKHTALDEVDDLPEHLRDHTMFVAYAPADQPQIAIAVLVEHSKEARNIARKVLDAYLLPRIPEAIPGDPS